MTDAKNIFNRIKEALTAKNAPEIARKIGITKQSVYEWEEKTPSIDSLKKISKTGNVSLHWLITGEGSMEVVDEKVAGLINMKNLKDVIREIVREEMQTQNRGTMTLPINVGYREDSKEKTG